MPKLGNVIDTRVRGVQTQIRNLQSVATSPRGPFQTLDKVVQDFRNTNKTSVKGLGVGSMLRGKF